MLLSEVFLQSEGAHCIGDINTVTIGENTNVQDRAVLASAKKSHYSDGTLKLGNNPRFIRWQMAGKGQCGHWPRDLGEAWRM